jgi:uncharacterized protein YkwD
MNFSRVMFFMAVTTAAFGAPASTRELAAINELRTKDCPRPLARDQVLKPNAKLAAAAEFVNARRSMREALDRAGYRSEQSAEIHMNGVADDALKRMLRSYCKTLTNPGLAEVGIAKTGKDIAFVFAAPFAPPVQSDAAKVERDVLQLVNAARSKPRRCGPKSFAAAPPLSLDATLHAAAVAHANDMARHGEVVHEGSDGSSPDERATRAGYRWRSVGENVAGGQLSAAEVVSGWLSSPHHCENIMDKDFTQMAVAFAVNPKQKIAIYWAQEFGTPR